MKHKHIFKPGNRYLIIFLAFISAFAPISTDLYLPALPLMAQSLQTSETMASLTISGFILVFAVSMLIWGPLSDKYGRRPVLLTGSMIYTITSMVMACTDSINILLAMRFIQAAGSGAVCSMALAIVKDLLRGKQMETAVSWIQSITILAPVMAPLLGGVILLFTNWRGIFWCLALCGFFSLAGSLAIAETLRKPLNGSPFAIFLRIPHVLAHARFSSMLAIFSATALPLLGYIGVSAYIFQGQFGLSPQKFSYFFAFLAAPGLAGPIMHMRFFSQWQRERVISAHLLILAISGCLLLGFGELGPFWFASFFVPVGFCCNAMRPPATMLMLNCHESDTGSVTALIHCGGLLMGSVGMFIATLPFWPNPVFAIACLCTVTGITTTCGWLMLCRKTVIANNRG